MEQLRYLITGGAGFLGSHLCDRLIRRGEEVLCVDNFFTGSRRNVEHLLGNRRFELLRHDVCFPLYVEVDRIFNLACPASPLHYQHDPVQTTKTSVHGAINMLGLAKRLKARILQASTSEVYGDRSCIPSLKVTGAGLILLVSALATMRGSGVLKRSFSIIGGSTLWRSRWCVFSIPTVPGCIPMMAVL